MILCTSVVTAERAKNGKGLVNFYFNEKDSDYPLTVYPKQALVMLQKGGLLVKHTIEDIYDFDNHTFSESFYDALNTIRGGEIIGSFELTKAGSPYYLEEGHPDVENGTAKVGEKRLYKNTQLRIKRQKGIDNLPFIYPISQAKLNADSYAEAKVKAETPQRSFKKLVSIEEQENEPAIFQTEE